MISFSHLHKNAMTVCYMQLYIWVSQFTDWSLLQIDVETFKNLIAGKY